MYLRCQDLQCRRGARILFAGVSFDLRAGEGLRIGGDNGSGKSTLLRIVSGLRQPDSGSVCWHGENVYGAQASLRQDLLYVGHAPGVKDCLSGWENLVHGELLSGPGARETALAALDKVGLAAQAGALVRTLSQGQRKRVALARLHLPRQRQVWILDEPFVGLDGRATDALCEAIQAHRDTGGIVLYTTHHDVGPMDVRQLHLGGARC